MSNHYLGESFDIHGGGRDLLFPHHENERAQSVAATGGRFANFWVHNGFVTVESEKMSKSLGNFLTIRDALKTYHPEVLRLFLLSKHYRSPLDFAKDEVEAMQSGLVRIYRTLERLEEVLGPREPGDMNHVNGRLSPDRLSERQSSFLDRFVKAMDDDLNTAGAVGVVFDKVRDMNKSLDKYQGEALGKDAARQLADDREELYLAGGVLGLLHESPSEIFKELSADGERIDPDEVEALIRQRSAARAEKDWARADEIRDRLKGMGIVLEDGPQGTSWRYDV
jgi:cysteinyl-tRNA synthetase